METKTIKSIDLIALACRTISSDHVLLDPSPGGAISIVHDDRGRHRTLSIEGMTGPPKAIHVRDVNDGGPCAISAGNGSGGHDPFSLIAF